MPSTKLVNTFKKRAYNLFSLIGVRYWVVKLYRIYTLVSNL